MTTQHKGPFGVTDGKRVHGQCPTCRHYGSDCECRDAKLAMETIAANREEAEAAPTKQDSAAIHKGCGGVVAWDAWVGRDGEVFGPYDQSQCQTCGEENPEVQS